MTDEEVKLKKFPMLKLYKEGLQHLNKIEWNQQKAIHSSECEKWRVDTAKKLKDYLENEWSDLTRRSPKHILNELLEALE